MFSFLSTNVEVGVRVHVPGKSSDPLSSTR